MNRNLRMSTVQAIGFDMDHTLALYARRPFEELAFEEAKKKLLAAGYPDEVADLRYDSAFVIRGLVVDKRRGNILKMDQHRYVARATHGTHPLPAETRKLLYQTRPIRLSSLNYVPVDTPFSLPEIDLYAQLVNLVDERRWRSRNYRTLYDQVRAAVDLAHADGSIKDRIARDPDAYLLPDPLLPATLDRLRAHGFRLFLLTNSEASYTNLIMDRLLSRRIRERAHWTDFFDVIVVRAGKPGFFRDRSDPVPVDIDGRWPRDHRPKTYQGGGVAGLESLLGCGGDRVLYFGDHTYGDILKSKRVRLWRTAMVVQELEDELLARSRMHAEYQQLRALLDRREELDEILDALERLTRGDAPPLLHSPGSQYTNELSETAREQLAVLKTEIDGLDDRIDRGFNPHWGPIFRTEHEPSLFASQVREFACIYTGRVSNFMYYAPDKYFQIHPETMSHERV